jgi:polyhydroxyalkanoate synthesis regulator phasin
VSLTLRSCLSHKRAYLVTVMIDLVKKTMLAGIGLAVVTKDKVLESLDELVEKGKLTKEEAAAMSEKIVEEGKVETEKAKVEASKLFIDMLNRANVVTKDQYDALAERVTELEGKLHQEFPNGE